MSNTLSKYHRVTDEYLITRIRSGDRPAFAELYHRYGARMYGYFFRALANDPRKAEDFTQELFLKLLEKVETFDARGSFKSWLYAIAGNMVKNEYRRLGRRPAFAELEESKGITYKDPSDKMDHEELMGYIRKAIQSLEESHRTCFVLRYQEELSIQEISEIVQCPPGTVKSRIHYATKKLSRLLQALVLNVL